LDVPEEQPPLAAARQSHTKWARLGVSVSSSGLDHERREIQAFAPLRKRIGRRFA